MEIISAIIFQLTRNLNVDDLRKGGFDAYYIDHTTGIYPVDASGNPFSALTFQSTGALVHFQRFGEALRITQEGLDAKNFYAFNPQFDQTN